MEKLIILALLTLLGVVHSMHVFHSSEEGEIENCATIANKNFEKTTRTTQIKVNDQLTTLDKLDRSTKIKSLSISNTQYKLSDLNITYDNLEQLDLSFTGLKNTYELENKTFPVLKSLNVSNNQLESFHHGLFRKFLHLEVFDASFNCLRLFSFMRIHHDQQKFKKFYLNNNQLNWLFPVPQNIENKPSLEHLDASFNLLRTFKDSNLIIKNLNVRNNSLRVLELSNGKNMMVNAEYNQLEVFEGSRSNFLMLNLSNNNFMHLASVVVSNVAILDLSCNHIVETRRLVSYMSDSDESSQDDIVWVNNHPIRVRESEKTKPIVHFLNLENNKISTLEVVHYYRVLFEVNLKSNQMTEFTADVFNQSSNSLKHVMLNGNPFASESVQRIKDFQKNNTLAISIIFETSKVHTDTSTAATFPSSTTLTYSTTTAPITTTPEISSSTKASPKSASESKTNKNSSLPYWKITFAGLVIIVVVAIFTIRRRRTGLTSSYEASTRLFNEIENPIN